MGEIIVAVIGGVFALLVAFVHNKKKCDCNIDPYRNLMIPNQVLPDIYEPPNNANLSNSKYIKVTNGKYKIKVPSGLKMVPSNTTGLVNVFKLFTSNYDSCDLEVNLSNVKGRVELFVKRFDDNWNFVENDAIETINANNGLNIFTVTSRIGEDDVKKEQIGIMVYSNHERTDKRSNLYSCMSDNYSYCNINSAIIKF